MSFGRGIVRLLGAGAIVAGVWFLFDSVRRGVAAPIGTVVWLGSGPVIVDLIAIPVSVVIAVGLTRILPPWARASVAAGVILMALVFLVSWPFVLGVGGLPANPSTLNRPYGVGLVAVWCVIAVSSGVVTWVAWWRDRKTVSQLSDTIGA